MGTIDMNNVKEQKVAYALSWKPCSLWLVLFWVFYLQALGIVAVLTYILVGGVSIAVYYLVARPVLARHPFNPEETPKSFLKKCVKCGKEIPIASEECPYCGAKQP